MVECKGKPVVAGAEFILPCESTHIVESKSFKLYLNSFNNSSFASFTEVEQLIKKDLAKVGAPFAVKLFPLAEADTALHKHLQGICIDDLDIACDAYTINPDFLTCEKDNVTETLYSDLLKSNCLVTSQPDWGSVQIIYTGKKINRAGLLKYIVSFRNCNEFAESCVERLFTDINTHCQPEKLCVYTRFTRRGGLDINPYRANYPVTLKNERLWRQ